MRLQRETDRERQRQRERDRDRETERDREVNGLFLQTIAIGLTMGLSQGIQNRQARLLKDTN